ncbi:threonine synthase, partial [Striga asiatica]
GFRPPVYFRPLSPLELLPRWIAPKVLLMTRRRCSIVLAPLAASAAGGAKAGTAFSPVLCLILGWGWTVPSAMLFRLGCLGCGFRSFAMGGDNCWASVQFPVGGHFRRRFWFVVTSLVSLSLRVVELGSSSHANPVIRAGPHATLTVHAAATSSDPSSATVVPLKHYRPTDENVRDEAHHHEISKVLPTRVDVIESNTLF